MSEELKAKLAKLPTGPGVYFHKNSKDEIIYIGKAANLRSRVRQYFQSKRLQDVKTTALVKQIVDIDWRELDTEADALFVEAELVRRYRPPYNILLRDDKSLQYVRIDIKSDYPTVSLVRRPLDDGAEYFGPYTSGVALKKALRYLRRAFPYATSRSVGQKRVSLHYHIGLDPGLEEGRTSLNAYRINLRKLMRYLRGERKAIIKSLETEMKRAAAKHDYETAAARRNQLFALQELSRQVLFSDREIMEAQKDQALVELAALIGLDFPPKRIEGFDISHMQGSDTVASMVVFSNGLPNKAAYRKFKMRLKGNDDFAHIAETLSRRLREDNRNKWGIADLMLIDGGKGQLSAALKVRDQAAMTNIPTIGLAKKQEQIIIHKQLSVLGLNIDELISRASKADAYLGQSGEFITVTLPSGSLIVKLLQRIRDESHRFAVSYHTVLKRGRQTRSLLDEIPGVGPVTRKKLMKHFGSTKAIMQANPEELKQLLGAGKGAQLARHINDQKAVASR